jgi:hypothetical protein
MQKLLKNEGQKRQNFIEIIKRMLSFNPDHRPSLVEIIKFLNKVET